MAKQEINIGTSANSGTGDVLRTAFTKINANFNELYARSTFDAMSVLTLANSSTIQTSSGNLDIIADNYVRINSGSGLGQIEIGRYQQGGNVILGGSTTPVIIDGQLMVNTADIVDQNGNSLLGGGGNANTGDVTFTSTSLIGINNSLILKSDLTADYGVEVYNSMDNDTHLRPLTRDKGVALGFAYGMGSHIRVEGYNGQGGIPGSGDRVGIFAMSNDSGDSHEWIFNYDGRLSLGNNFGAIYADQNTGEVTIGDFLGPNGQPAMPSTTIRIGGNDAFVISRGNGSNNPYWQFTDSGNLVLPQGGDIQDYNGNSVLGGGGSSGPSVVDYSNRDNGNGNMFIDLTATHHVLSSLQGNPSANRRYYLPNGTEGQVLYFTPGPQGFDAANNVFWIDTYFSTGGYNTGVVKMFDNPTNAFATLVTATFVYGAWRFTGPVSV